MASVNLEQNVDLTPEQIAENGKRIADARLTPGWKPSASMVEGSDLGFWLHRNEKQVEYFGECLPGCSEQNLLPDGTCTHTNKPCDKLRLQPLLDLLGKVNG